MKTNSNINASNQVSELDPEIYYNQREAAKFLGLSSRTLSDYRYKGIGPKYFAISGKYIRYKRKDLIAWMDAQAVEVGNTADV